MVWSPLQQLNVDTVERQEALQADRDYQEVTFLKLVKRGYQKQQREGRHAAVEQPKNARSWVTPTFIAMEGFHSIFHQCQYGVTLPDENYEEQYVKKPTKLRCTDETMALDLARTCQGEHWHLPVEGSSPGIGSRSAASRIYQAELCYSFYLAIEQIFAYKGQDAIYVADDEAEVKEEFKLEEFDEEKSEALEPESPDEPPAAPSGVLTRLRDEDMQKARRTITRLHRNLGHPSKKELVCLLQNKNASSAVLTAAREHECQLCELHRRPTGVPVSSMPRNSTLNHRVQADTLWISSSWPKAPTTSAHGF